LKNKPVCVLSNNDGCVISRSREAKKLGVKMGMPYFMSKKEFPNCNYVSSKMEQYQEFSSKIMLILKNFSPDVEVYSIDEAFLDLTGLRRLYKRNYIKIAQMIRAEILDKVDIPVSIGLSPTKTLAKLASDKAKNTGGIYIIGSRKIPKELQQTSIDKVWGIGSNTSSLLNKYGILTAYEFISQTDEWIKSKLNITAMELKHELLGESVSKVDNKIKIPQSLQRTSSFAKSTSDRNYIISSLNYHIHKACTKLRQINATCSCVSIMLKTKEFKVFREKRILHKPTDFEFEISNIAKELFEKIYNPNTIYRSSGIILDRFTFNNEEQLYLFANNENDNKKKNLSKCIDKIEQKYGKNSIKTGY